MEELEQPFDCDNQNSQNCEKENIINDDTNLNESVKNSQNLEENLEDCKVDGSNLLGKFNDVDELLKAYNNLQAEFTRKCQKLSMLEKENEEKKNQENSLNQKADVKPIYMQENFDQSLTDFLAEKPNAKQYAKEISLELINDSSLNLVQAYERVFARKFKEPEELLKDNDFVQNYILTNEGLKKELLKEYVKSVKESTVPHLISGNFGLSGNSANIEISSLEEANKLALKLFRD